MESFIKISDEAQTGKLNVFLDLSLKCFLNVGNTVQMTTELNLDKNYVSIY